MGHEPLASHRRTRPGEVALAVGSGSAREHPAPDTCRAGRWPLARSSGASCSFEFDRAGWDQVGRLRSGKRQRLGGTATPAASRAATSGCLGGAGALLGVGQQVALGESVPPAAFPRPLSRLGRRTFGFRTHSQNSLSFDSARARSLQKSSSSTGGLWKEGNWWLALLLSLLSSSSSSSPPPPPSPLGPRVAPFKPVAPTRGLRRQPVGGGAAGCSFGPSLGLASSRDTPAAPDSAPKSREIQF